MCFLRALFFAAMMAILTAAQSDQPRTREQGVTPKSDVAAVKVKTTLQRACVAV